MVRVRGRERSLRLVAFERGWLVSVESDAGPTLGADRSLYLATWRALQPLGVDLVDAMLAVTGVARDLHGGRSFGCGVHPAFTH